MFSFFDANAQKKVKKKVTSIDFEYKGQLFQIIKGTKINVGIGTADNGEFKYIWTEEATGVGTIHYKRIKHNAEREKSNKDALVTGFWYDKFNKNYIVYISFNKWDRHHIMLSEAAESGELLAIDDFQLSVGKDNKAVSISSASKTNSLSHILKLKNGSEIKCNIVELKPSESIKVETFDGSIFVFKMDEVEAMVKQESSSPKQRVDTNTKGYRNGSVTGDFEEIEKRVRKDTINGLYNSTEIYYLMSLRTTKPNDFTSKYGGLGFSHFIGYQFNSYIVLGGVIGFNHHIGEYPPNSLNHNSIARKISYSYPFIGLAQRFLILGDKKLSPEISFVEGLGLTFANNFETVWILEGGIGVVYKFSKKIKVRAGLGFSYNSAHFSNGYNNAQYLKIHAGINF